MQQADRRHIDICEELAEWLQQILKDKNVSAPSIESLMMYGHASVGQRVTADGEPTMFSAAVRCNSRNGAVLPLALQVMDRLQARMRQRVLGAADGAGFTALMDACRAVSPDASIVQKLLLSYGANATVNVSNADGLSALMVASAHGFSSAVRLLVDEHADLDQLDARGVSALQHACRAHAAGAAAVLVAADANLHIEMLGDCMSTVILAVGSMLTLVVMAIVLVAGLVCHLRGDGWVQESSRLAMSRLQQWRSRLRWCMHHDEPSCQRRRKKRRGKVMASKDMACSSARAAAVPLDIAARSSSITNEPPLTSASSGPLSTGARRHLPRRRSLLVMGGAVLCGAKGFRSCDLWAILCPHPVTLPSLAA